MRDNPAHNVPMLGGTWAAKLDDLDLRLKWKQSMAKMFKDRMAYAPRTQSGPDQTLLKR